MRTLLVEPPEEVRAWLERRQKLGQDLFDEVWEGVYHVAPAPHPAHGELDDQLARILGPFADDADLRGSGPLNVGEPNDYRVPDRAYYRRRPETAFVPVVDLVVEIASPADETWDKLPFYFARGVQEVVVVDPTSRSVHWFRRGAEMFEPTDGSDLLAISSAELRERLDWPRSTG